MADRRIHISKQHEEFVNRLCNANDDEYNGPFKTKADVLAFAAAYGASKGKWTELKETAKDPIRKGVFDTAGYGTLINLLAVAHTEDPNILAATDGMEDRRAGIFEEYANAGLSALDASLRTAIDFSSEIDLIITQLRTNPSGKEINITNLLSK